MLTGTRKQMRPYWGRIVFAHAEEWPLSSDPMARMGRRFDDLCGRYGSEAEWTIILDKNDLVATVTIGYEKDQIYVYNLLVVPEYRNQGYSRQLLEHLLTKHKGKQFIGSAKEKLLPLYAKFGAHAVGEASGGHLRLET